MSFLYITDNQVFVRKKEMHKKLVLKKSINLFSF